jgi:hypothetical protein
LDQSGLWKEVDVDVMDDIDNGINDNDPYSRCAQVKQSMKLWMLVSKMTMQQTMPGGEK